MQTAVHLCHPSTEPAVNGRAFRRGPVCLLDDDLSMLKALDRLLKAEGFEVTKFSQSDDFLSSIRNSGCRVAILDVWMPDMNGLEVHAILRKESPEVRVIFISGRDDPSVRQAALEGGAFGFLSKPFDDETLVQMIDKAVAG